MVSCMWCHLPYLYSQLSLESIPSPLLIPLLLYHKTKERVAKTTTLLSRTITLLQGTIRQHRAKVLESILKVYFNKLIPGVHNAQYSKHFSAVTLIFPIVPQFWFLEHVLPNDISFCSQSQYFKIVFIPTDNNLNYTLHPESKIDSEIDSVFRTSQERE